jgi:hypothetical protein
MHPEAYAYVAEMVAAFGPRQSVVELGSRDFNGSVRGLFNGAAYCGVDALPGYGVDVVADAAEFEPDMPPDTVVCCEVLEHTPNAAAICANARRMLGAGGVLIVTCATDPRAPHSAYDGLTVRDGEFYRNVPPDDLMAWLRGFEGVACQAYIDRGDLYAVAVKP